jgi:hypothetical protein
MNRRFTLIATTAALFLLAIPTPQAVAQEKQNFSFKVPAENTTYPRQQNIEVGDRPNHVVRVFESHTPLPITHQSSTGSRSWSSGAAASPT